MKKDVIFRDTRLEGNFSFWTSAFDSIFELTETTPVIQALRHLYMTAQSNGGKVKTLSIMCHGYGTYTSKELFGYEIPVWDGGEGLQLGAEGLTINGISVWSTIKDKVEEIIVYACGAADVQDGGGDLKNGKVLMSRLAQETNADVYAAEELQYYRESGMDFKAWDGQLYQFKPNGQVSPVFLNIRL